MQNPVPVRESIAQRPVATFRTVTSSAAHALRPHDALLRRVQDLVQHLTDGAVLPVERIRVHLRSLLFDVYFRKIGSAQLLNEAFESSVDYLLVGSRLDLVPRLFQVGYGSLLYRICPIGDDLLD